MAAVATWALWPPPPYEQSLAAPEAEPVPPPHSARDTGSFPTEAFAANLWNEPPEPVQVKRPEPPKMPNLQLIAITHSDGAHIAIIQDDDAGEMRTVSSGDRLGVTTVVGIDAAHVHCEAHGQRFDLSLEMSKP